MSSVTVVPAAVNWRGSTCWNNMKGEASVASVERAEPQWIASHASRCQSGYSLGQAKTLGLAY